MHPANTWLFITIGICALVVVFIVGVWANEMYATRRHPKPVRTIDLTGAQPVPHPEGWDWQGEFPEAPIVAHEGEKVWIPAVPLPLYGLRADRCSCGKRFRGNTEARATKYEAHWRTVHEPAMRHDTHTQVTVEEARRVYASARTHA